MADTAEQTAAETYFEATGTWPEGYTPPGEMTEEEKHKAADKVYYDATGHWPGEKPADVKREEADGAKFSHYLELADGRTVRFLVNPNRPDVPNDWNGVPVVRVHNSHAPGREQ